MLSSSTLFAPRVGVGGDAAAHTAGPRRVAQDAGQLDVPRANLLLGGHQPADAGGGQTLPARRPELQRYHEKMRGEPESQSNECSS